MTQSGRDPRLSGLVGPFVALFRVVTAASGLMRSEAALAKAEAKQAAADVVRGIVMVLVAVVFAMVALTLLAQAGVHGLMALGLSPGWANLAAGAGLLVIALVLILIGKGHFNASQKMSRHVGDRVNSNMTLLRREMGSQDV